MKLREGDRILMCTDGLSNMVENDEIRDIVREHEDIDEAIAHSYKESMFINYMHWNLLLSHKGREISTDKNDNNKK